MADIQVRIKLNAGVSGDEIQSVDFNQETNNVSKAIGSKTTKNAGQNLISWGQLTAVKNGKLQPCLSLADGYVGGMNSYLGKQGGYNGFVFGVVPENKMYSVEVSLEGDNIDSVTVYGDRNAKQFPTRAYLDGDTSNYIYSDDAEWTIIFPSASQTHTITFDMWNRANYNACLTHIGVFVNELVLDKRQIKSVESLSQSTGRPKDIYYGFTPSSGNIEIIDVNGEIKDYIQDGILNSNNVQVELKANGSTIHNHLSVSSDYNLESNILSMDLTSLYDSNIEDLGLNKLLINENIQDFSSIGGISLKDILQKYVFDNKNIDLMLLEKIPFDDFEITILEYLELIKTNYFYVYNKTKREILDEVCNAAQIAFNGSIFLSMRKNVSSTISPIIIPKSRMFSKFSEDMFIVNKYNAIKINQPEIIKVRDYVYSKDFTIKEDGVYGEYTTKYIGLDAKIFNNQFPWIDTRPFIDFSDNIQYDDKNMFILKEGDALYEVRKTSNTEYTESNNTHAFNSASKIKTFGGQLYFEPISNYGKPLGDFGDYCYLENAASDHKNSEPYVFKFSLDLYPWYYAGEAGILYYPSSITVKVLADKYEVNSREFHYGSGDNVVELTSDVLLHQNTSIKKYDGQSVSIPEFVASNILQDYKNGLRTARVSISCGDYYDANGNLRKKWENGHIISVGDVVKIETSHRLWKVSGRNFRKAGVPMVDLELQEVVVVPVNLIKEYYGTSIWAITKGEIYKRYSFNNETKTLEFHDSISDFSTLNVGDEIFYKLDDSRCYSFKILEIYPSGESDTWHISAETNEISVNK